MVHMPRGVSWLGSSSAPCVLIEDAGVRLFWEAALSRREETSNSCLMETCWLAGWLEGLGGVSPLPVPVTDTALFVREKIN